MTGSRTAFHIFGHLDIAIQLGPVATMPARRIAASQVAVVEWTSQRISGAGVTVRLCRWRRSLCVASGVR